MRLRILGPCEVYDAVGRVQPIRRRKARALLSLLLYGRNHTVSTQTLIARLWGDRPPASAVANLQTYVSDLRRALAAAELAGCLHTTGDGYLLQVRPGQLDADVFDDLVEQGRRALRDGSAMLAAVRLGRALDLWRGDLGAGLELAGPPHPEPARLAVRRLAALTDWIDARLRLGQHAELAAELPALLHRHPDHEPLHGQLMLAHYRCGQPEEAARVFHRLRTGRPPGAAVTALYRRILRHDAELAAPAGDEPGRRVPRQLPALPARFVGRQADLARMDRLLAEPDRGPVLIAGGPGVGKSALALHWAHRVAGRFPDGQLHADLRGYAAESPAEPLEILQRFLADLGERGRPPQTVEEAAGRFRSIMAGRRMLLVLDDAASPAQVRPLLPGTAGCLVLVSSRDRLDGLVAREGAHRIRIGLLGPADADALLRQMWESGEGADPVDAAGLAERCGYLPLALRIVGTRGGTSDPLHCSDGERSVRTAFDFSYRRLAEPEQRVFRLLGQLTGREINTVAIAATAATTEHEAGEILDRLARASLIDQIGAGYRLSGLLRVYARELG